MSNNAITAYESGEKPLSKWTKAVILEAVENEEVELKISMETLKKIPVNTLKEKCLAKSSWHHTSSHYNKTDFYDIWWNGVENLTDKDADNVTVKEKETEERWLCKFLEWSGTRKHPKATEYEEEGIIKGNWFYRSNGTKKSINANGFEKIRRIDAA